MTHRAFTRRQMALSGLGLGLTGLLGLPRSAMAETPIPLQWSDLMPRDGTQLPPTLQGMVNHDAGSMISQQPQSSGVVTEYNGKTVSLPGFVVPLDYDGSALTVFMLVPYVGACVHVPPPPANQLVLVTTEKPYDYDGLFEAVTVTGMFGTAATSTQLAEVGYALSADRIEPYQ